VCAWCGQRFTRPHTRGPAPKYCSKAHRQRAHEARQAQHDAAGVQLAELTSRRALEASRAFDDVQRFAAFDAAAILREFGAASTLSKQVAEIHKQALGALNFDAAAILRDVGAASTLSKQVADIQKQALGVMSFDAGAILRDATSAASLTQHVADIQKQAFAAMDFDAAAILRDVGAASTLSKQVADIQKQALGVMSFDAGAILRDATSTASLTQQVAEVQKQALGAFSFDASSILAGFDLTRAERAVADGDLADLEALLPTAGVDDPSMLPTITAVALVAILLAYLHATLAQLGTLAVESVSESASSILSATETAYQSSPQVRGLVILLGVLASIETLRRND